jgi:uncharacterized membrane protein YccC
MAWGSRVACAAATGRQVTRTPSFLLDAAAHDPGHVSLRRGLRAAVVLPLVLASAMLLGLGPAFATFLVFGGMSLLVLADFGGPARQRVTAYLTSVALCVPLVIVGTLASANVWTATAATAIVGLAVCGVAVLGGYFATAQTTLLLAFVLAVASPGSLDTLALRVAGWCAAGLAATLAGWLLWPRSSHVALCAAAAGVLRTVAAIVAARRQPAEVDSTVPLEAAARDGLTRLRDGFVVAQRRPSGATQRDRALAELVTDMERALEFSASAGPGASEPRLTETTELADAVVRAFAASAAILEGCDATHDVEQLIAARDAHRTALDRWATQQLDAGAAPETVVDGLAAAHPLRVMAYVGLTIAQDAEVAVGRPLTGIGNQAIRRGLGSTLREEITPSSIWLRNSVRTAVGLAVAVLVARSLAVPYAFWVVLGTISALRGTASATGKTAIQALGGTALGVLVAVPFVALAGGDTRFLWIVLPLLVFLAAYTPLAVNFVVGQAAFSLLVVVLFNILAPSGPQIGLVRVEDAALGVGVSAIVGLMLWPRGARGQLRAALAALYSADATYLSASLRRLLGGPDHLPVSPDALRAVALTESIRADEVFDLFLRDRGTQIPPVEVWAMLLSGGKRLRLIGEVIDWLAERGYAARDTQTDTVAMGSLANDALANVVRLAGEVEGGRLLRVTPTHDTAAARRAAAIAGLSVPNITASPAAMRSAIGLAAAADWLAQLEATVNQLEAPVAQAGAAAGLAWWRR